MYPGYLELGGVELFNNARTAAYIKALVPGLKVKCDEAGLHRALGDAAYSSPSLDTAPWYRSANTDTAKFLGLYTSSIEGDEDSTRSMEITELAGDGAVQALARHGSKEIRVKGWMIAQDQAGMQSGWAWLRSVLDDNPCGGTDLYCEGRPLHFFKASPAAAVQADADALVAKYARVTYRVEPVDGPRRTAVLPSKHAVIWEVEFTLNAGVPWTFTLPAATATTTGVSPTSVGEVTCQTQTDAYDDLIVDPLVPWVTRPPKPPAIEPYVMPASWNRYVMSIPSSLGARSGRVVPTIVCTTGAEAMRVVRVRLYRTGFTDPCDFEGEFFITYVPPNAVLTINGPERLISVTVGGKVKPGANLVVGSSGRPVKWPSMACGTSYQVYVEADGALNGTVRTDISIRE
jgi:hypothetical protein